MAVGITRTGTPQNQVGFGWGTGALLIVAAVLTAALLYIVFDSDDSGTMAPMTNGETPAVASATQDPDLVLARLATQGYIPPEAVNWDRVELKRLVDQGLVPAEALLPATTNAEPLFTETELLAIHLAVTGQIPMEAVDWETVELKRLVNQGLIPLEALEK